MCIEKDSKVYEAYKEEHIQERHRHRYEFNNDYRKQFEEAGMKCVGINPESDLVEIVEIPTLKWYIGTQFHPEYSSTVLHRTVCSCRSSRLQSISKDRYRIDY